MLAFFWEWSPWFRNRRRAAPGRGRRRSRVARTRLSCEPLEERALLSGAPPGSTLATALPVHLVPGVPQALGGAITAGGEVVLYAVDLAPQDLLTVSDSPPSQGTPLEGVLRLFDSTGTPLAANDDFASQDATLEFGAAAAGRYYVGVSGYDNGAYDPTATGSGPGNATGAYTLNLEVTPGAAGPSSTLATATPLSVAPGKTTLLPGSLSDPADANLYSLQLQQGQQLDVSVFHQGNSPDFLDTVLRVFDGSGTEIAYDESFFEPVRDSGQRVYIPQSGTYYVGVSGYPNDLYDPTVAGSGSGGQTGPYELQLRVHPALVSSNGTLDTATPIAVIRNRQLAVSGAINQNRDVNLYSLDLHAGDQVFLQTEARVDGDTPFSPLLDTYVRVFDGTGAEIAANDDANDNTTNSATQFVAPVAGRYFIGVSSYGNDQYDPTEPLSGSGSADSTGFYTLDLTIQPPPPASSAALLKNIAEEVLPNPAPAI
jgi:hypothetical protein